MFELDRKCMYPGHTPQLQPGEKPIIQIHHDEFTFYANADQSKYWGDSILKQKSLGQAIMASEENVSEYLQHHDQEARLLLETNIDGYFNKDMLIKQVDKAIQIFSQKYPQAVFLFDNAPSHKKYADDMLIADRMNR